MVMAGVFCVSPFVHSNIWRRRAKRARHKSASGKEQRTMEEAQLSLLIMGALCIIAAIVGGNLKLLGAQFGPLKSGLVRQWLGIAGAVLIASSFVLPSLYAKGPTK